MKNFIIKLRSGEPDEVVQADTVEEASKNGIDWLVFKAGSATVAKFAEDAVKSWKAE